MPATPPLPASHATAEQPARVYVIAEIGVNHDGCVDRARSLIDAAARAGADAVKFQHFTPRRLLSHDALLAEYQSPSSTPEAHGVSPWASAEELLEPLALSIEQLAQLAEHAHRCGLHFIVTPFTLQDAEELRTLPLDAVKIASPDAVNTPLLDAAASLGRPVIVSTGTCDLDELADAARIVTQTRGALLHCVSSYPTPPEQAALGGIAALRQAFDASRVGYSDHTAQVQTAALAVSAGACLLEKHLTYDRAAAGPDHAASLEPADFAEYAALARSASLTLGPIIKRCTPIERDVRKVSRQSVTTMHALPAGHVLCAQDLTIQRPGTGIPAAELPTLVGRRLARPVAAHRVLMPEDLA